MASTTHIVYILKCIVVQQHHSPAGRVLKSLGNTSHTYGCMGVPPK